ncbi:MAG: alpha/beta hydrolase [Proteobacteria bacterium]|nr:alpha/beta hydrolase [Pseudomonadota bacterium]
MPEIIFNGPTGRLEGRYHHSRVAHAPVAILLHPHPQHGGTMNNRVIYGLYQTFARLGMSVLRFNFRGIGRSQGTFDNGVGELSDAASALDWLQTVNPSPAACWIAGFSFGAWIAMQLLMRRPEISAFIAIAPPANVYDFSFLAPCPSSGLILHGERDEVVPEPAVAKLAQKLASQRGITIDYQVIKGASHFFQDHMDALNERVSAYVKAAMARIPAPVD